MSVGGVAVALAASLAAAKVAPAAGPVPADGGARLPLLSPEAAPGLGEVGDESPLVAVFNAARVAGDGAPSLALFMSPKLDFTPVGEIALINNAAHADRPQGQANDAAARVDDAQTSPFAPAPVGALPEGPSAQDNPPGFAAAPAASASPLESALEAALERLVARGDQPNPLGAGDWRAARGGDCGLLRRARLFSRCGSATTA